MAERGIDISGQASKSVETIDAASVDIVVTLCAQEVCPVFLGTSRQLHWPLPDPALAVGSEQVQIERFRDVRDQIADRLDELLLAEPSSPHAPGAP